MLNGWHIPFVGEIQASAINIIIYFQNDCDYYFSYSLSLVAMSVVECHHLKTENEIPIEFFMNMLTYITMLCVLHVRVHILGNNQITNVACEDDTYAWQWQYKISDVLG